MNMWKPQPLRERKAARIRHGLLTSAIRRMSESPFEAIRVIDLCRDVEITEQTFFNYFPSKGVLLSRIILLWGIETEYRVRKLKRPSRLGAIEAVFELTTTRIEHMPRVAAELLGRLATRRGPPQFPEITVADRLLWYPDLPGIDQIPAVGILGILRPRVRAIELGELPRSCDAETVVLALYSVFVGVPLMLLWQDPTAVRSAFREQIAILWRGLGAERRR